MKLTGEGRMPVMSPCGKIIENLEPTYEEKLERLLENENCSIDINYPNSSYVNVETIENDSQETCPLTENNSSNTEQNYTNIGFVQTVENYENFKNFFKDPSKHIFAGDLKSECLVMKTKTNENVIDVPTRNNIHTNCANCGHKCSIINEDPCKISEQLHENVDHHQLGLKNEIPSVYNPQCILSNKNSDNHNTFEIPHTFLEVKCNSTSCLNESRPGSFCSLEKNIESKRNIESKTLPKYSSSAANSPDLKRQTWLYSGEDQVITSKLQHLSIRNRSNSADSARIHMYDKSANDTMSTSSNEKTCVPSPSSADSLCTEEKLKDGNGLRENNGVYINTCDLKITPLGVQEVEDSQETFLSKIKLSVKYPDPVNARRSSSVPNKFFSNRDSSSSNDSGVSTGSFTLKQCGTDFLDFEMPLTTSMSSRRHHIAMINNSNFNNNIEPNHIIPKRSKSVDPLRDLTFTFDFGEQNIGKSISAGAEVPLFLQENRNKGKKFLHFVVTNAIMPNAIVSGGK